MIKFNEVHIVDRALTMSVTDAFDAHGRLRADHDATARLTVKFTGNAMQLREMYEGIRESVASASRKADELEGDDDEKR